MQVVESAAARPHMCAVLPQLGAYHKDGYVDTGNELVGFDPHIYISLVAVRQMASLIGLPTEDEHSAAVTERDELRARVAALEAEVAEADRFQESLAGVAAAGFQIHKRVGRKPSRDEKETVPA